MNIATQRCNAASPTRPVPLRTNPDLKRLLGPHKILHDVMIHASASISLWQQILPKVAANVTHRRESRVLKQTTIVRLSWSALLRAAWAGTTILCDIQPPNSPSSQLLCWIPLSVTAFSRLFASPSSFTPPTHMICLGVWCNYSTATVGFFGSQVSLIRIKLPDFYVGVTNLKFILSNFGGW